MHQRIRLAQVTLTALITALFGVVLPVLAPTAAHATTGWSSPETVDPVFSGTAVSCVSTTFCVAVGSDMGLTGVNTNLTGYASHFDGTSWSEPFEIDPGHALTSVSCPDISFCAAVDRDGNVVTQTNGVVGTPTTLAAGDRLVSISCATTSFCVALDQTSGEAFTYNGSSWSSGVVVDPGAVMDAVSCPPGTATCIAAGILSGSGNQVVTYSSGSWVNVTSIGGSGEVSGLSCPTVSFCAAVTGYGEALTETNGTWSAATTIDSQNNFGLLLYTVSCSSASFCVTIDGRGADFEYGNGTWTMGQWTPFGTGSGAGLVGAPHASCVSASFCGGVDTSGYAATWNGSNWYGAPAAIIGSGQLWSVSCASASFCATNDFFGKATTRNGATWSSPVMTSLGQAVLSCPSAQFCMAVSGVFADYGMTYTNGTWNAAEQITGQAYPMRAVSCPTAGYCVAGNQHGDVYVYSSGAWSSATPMGVNVTGLSCASTSFCLAVGVDIATGHGGASVFNGTSWSTVTDVDQSIGLVSVSCPTSSFCMAIDREGNARSYSSSTWGAPTAIGGSDNLTAVSCGSTSFCAAVDNLGNATMYNGSSWSAQASIDPIWLMTVSCPTSAYCVASDAVGNVVTYGQPGPAQHSLTVSKSGTGSGTVTSSPAGINCGATCTTNYDQGTPVTLTATPASGSTFTGWSGGGCSGTSTCPVTLNADTTVTASFKKLTYQPDLMIRPAGATLYVGSNKYSATGSGEGFTSVCHKGKTATFQVKVQNDGNVAQRITVHGPGNASGFLVQYLSGSTNITNGVEAGTYRTALLAPGTAVILTVRVYVRPGAVSGTVHVWRVVGTAHALSDAVRAGVKVA